MCQLLGKGRTYFVQQAHSLGYASGKEVSQLAKSDLHMDFRAKNTVWKDALLKRWSARRSVNWTR